MRPHRIALENFGCYRDKTELDLHDLTLFAIAGPTGAGKTTILDGMVFALFGEIPRIGKTGTTEFISLGRDRMSALLDFEVGAKRYRVARTSFRQANRAAKVQLEELRGEDTVPIADKVTTVNQEIERLLGLSSATFLQSVVLPQGEFARFLKASGGEQKKMLRALLRLETYEQMRKNAEQRKGVHDVAARDLQRRLDGEYAGVTPNAVDEKQAAITAIQSQRGAAKETFDRLTAASDGLGRRSQQQQQQRDWRTQSAALVEAKPAIDLLRSRLDGARLAAPIVPMIDAAAGMASAIVTAEAQLLTKTKDLAAATALATGDQDRLNQANAAADDLDGLRAALERAVTAAARAGEVHGLVTRVAEAEARHAAQQMGATAADSALSTATKALTAAIAAEQAIAATITGLGADPVALSRAEARQKSASLLVADRRRLRELSREVDAASDGVDATTRSLEAAQLLADDHATALAEARAAQQTAATHLRDAEDTHRAHRVRETLQPGAPCPVCLHVVHEIPTSTEHTPLDALRSRCDAATKAENAADKQARTAEINRRTAEQAELVARAALLRASTAVDTARLAIVQAETTLGPLDGAGELEDRWLAAWKRLRDAATEAAKRESERNNAANEAKLQQERASRARTDGDHARAALVAAAADIAGAIAALDAVRAEVRLLVPEGDPAAVSATITQRIRALEQALTAARAAADASERARATSSTAATVANDRCLEARGRHTEALAQLAATLHLAGFAGPEVARAAAATPAQQAQWQGQIDQWTADTRAIAAQLAALGDTGAPIQPAELAAALRQTSDANDQVAALNRAEGGLVEELVSLRSRLERAIALRADLAKEQTELHIYATLAADLGLHQFQDFLLRGTFEDLVAGASQRLFALSGRYTLVLREDREDLAVVDHDNASEKRGTDTLSGGETFLASLALALELSEQVQRAAGAVRLDSLFIDEGFGTLDPETLDTVAEAIEALAAENRMVGIITHVGELTNRLPARIDVRKTPEGSVATLVRT